MHSETAGTACSIRADLRGSGSVDPVRLSPSRTAVAGSAGLVTWVPRNAVGCLPESFMRTSRARAWAEMARAQRAASQCSGLSGPQFPFFKTEMTQEVISKISATSDAP